MRRDLSRLLERTFDLLVVGAGIQGACIAWDACLRGLSVALVDRGDFGAATSANSLGIVHGGLSGGVGGGGAAANLGPAGPRPSIGPRGPLYDRP